MRKILVTGMLLAAGLVAGVLGYFYGMLPRKAPASDRQVPMTAERLERGRYLFLLADCDGCHSQRDFTRFAGPVVESGRGAGNVFPDELGLPGRMVASNITPDMETGIGAWSDGEKIRAIREGIGRDGRPLFPFMPYTFYSKMSDEDVESLVAFLNTLKPVRNSLPPTSISFPVSMFVRSAPRPVAAVAPPDRGNPLRHGEYLATLGVCLECHTQADAGQLNESMKFAGGREFRMPFGTVYSSNITPDVETGIGRWSEDYFLSRFNHYKEYVRNGPPVVGPESFTLMPWLTMAQMEPADLKAIYTFLRAQPAVKNKVEKRPGFSAPAAETAAGLP